MTSEGLGVLFQGDFADTYAGKFPLMWMDRPSRGSSMLTPVNGNLPDFNLRSAEMIIMKVKSLAKNETGFLLNNICCKEVK